jgi:hypothetical protein
MDNIQKLLDIGDPCSKERKGEKSPGDTDRKVDNPYTLRSFPRVPGLGFTEKTVFNQA